MKMSIVSQACWRATDEAPQPDVSFVPAMARRRLTAVERAAMSVAHAAGGETAARCPLVFASRWGEIGTTIKLMHQMHEEGEMSPAGFSNSVHNAAPGAFSLFMKNRAAYTAIAARDRSLEAGLLEALVQLNAMKDGDEVLFVYAEESTPEFYLPHFADVQRAKAISMLIRKGGDVESVFRHADLPALGFDVLETFLVGGSVVLETSDFTLTLK